MKTAVEMVDRMEALVRRMATGVVAPGAEWLDPFKEARAIVAELPEPVDPDLLEAREIGIKEAYLPSKDTRSGGYDSHAAVACALIGIKRGRELALNPDHLGG